MITATLPAASTLPEATGAACRGAPRGGRPPAPRRRKAKATTAAPHAAPRSRLRASTIMPPSGSPLSERAPCDRPERAPCERRAGVQVSRVPCPILTAISGLWALKGTQSAIISWNRDAGIGGELVGCYLESGHHRHERARRCARARSTPSHCHRHHLAAQQQPARRATPSIVPKARSASICWHRRPPVDSVCSGSRTVWIAASGRTIASSGTPWPSCTSCAHRRRRAHAWARALRPTWPLSGRGSASISRCPTRPWALRGPG